VHQPKRVENARILIANTPMDTDKIKVFGSHVRVDSMAKIAELELAEKEKMRDKVNKILKHNVNVFINRYVTNGNVHTTFTLELYEKFSTCKKFSALLSKELHGNNRMKVLRVVGWFRFEYVMVKYMY
jgi:hypothetical protein